MISLKRIHLNNEVVSYEFHPNAGDDFGIVELNRKNNIAIITKEIENSNWFAIHALNRLEEYSKYNAFPITDRVIWY